MDGFYRKMIDLLKRQLSFGSISDSEISVLLFDLGKEIDRCKAYDKPCAELERLYGDALWLKCEISK